MSIQSVRAAAHGIFTQPERRRGLLESKAWWLEPHSKESDKGPEDSCIVSDKKHTHTQKTKKTGTMLGKIFKIHSVPYPGMEKANRSVSGM